jgi:hypothetical protein
MPGRQGWHLDRLTPHRTGPVVAPEPGRHKFEFETEKRAAPSAGVVWHEKC